jgi:hypothetical protein
MIGVAGLSIALLHQRVLFVVSAGTPVATMLMHSLDLFG